MSFLRKVKGSRRWYVVVTVDGKRREYPTGETDRKRAELVQARIDLYHSKRRLWMGNSRTELLPALSEFVRHLQATQRPKSLSNDLSRLRTVFGPVIEELAPRERGKARTTEPTELGRLTLLEELTPAMVMQAMDRHQAMGNGPKSANALREVLHRFCAFCESRFDTLFAGDGKNPIARVPKRRSPATEISVLTLDEIRAQLDALSSNPRLRVAVAVMLFAGLRREEVTWLTMRDLDLEQGWLTVRAKSDPMTGERWQPKTRKNRGVGVSEALASELRRYFAACGLPALWIVPSPTGKRWHPDNLSADLRAANKAAGLAWSALDYRHSFGSNLARQGLSLDEIAVWMGNSAQIASRHYVCSSALQSRRHLLDFMPPAEDGPKLRLVRPGEQTGPRSAESGVC